jgi:type IX secretion system PorP/SprF family membrane protein
MHEKSSTMGRSRILLLLILLFSGPSLFAQDPHLTQYDASPVILNPARTGMLKDAEYRSIAQFRSQWGTVTNKPFTNTSLAFDMPLDERWGIGGYILNTDAPRIYNSFQFVVSGAYEIMDPSQKEHSLTVGLQAGLIYKKIKQRELVFDQQYSNGIFNQNLPSGEEFDQQSRTMPELNMGFAYKMTNAEKTFNPFAGLGVFHISSPDRSLLSSTKESRLPRRYMFHAGSKVHVHERVKLIPKVLIQRQENIMEYLGGLHGSYRFENEAKTKLLLGGGYRLEDAAYGMLGVDHKNLVFRMSYDVNTSGLKAYSRGNGAWEFSVAYLH